MAKQAGAEDNRDIFEKALDSAPVIGAAIGMTVGGAIGRKLARNAALKKSNLFGEGRRSGTLDKALRTAGFVGGGAGVGGLVGLSGGVAAKASQKKRGARK